MNSNTRRATAKHPIATVLNLTLISFVLAGTLFQLFGMPIVFRVAGFRAALLLLPIMLIQPLQWGLIHEGIHSHLLRSRKTNEFFARLLSVAVGLPFDATRFGHLVHHRFSRHAYDRPDVFDGRGYYTVAWIRYWGRLFGGMYLTLMVSPLMACVPVSLGVRLAGKMIPVAEGGDAEVLRLYVSLVTNALKRRRTRHEFALTLALYGASAWMYGAWWPMLLATVYIRGLWHSFADNVPHHDVAPDEPERSRNYTVPAFFRIFLLNQHLHLTHHRHPTAPWTALVALTSGREERPTGNYFRAAFRQVNLSFPRFLESDEPAGPIAEAPMVRQFP